MIKSDATARESKWFTKHKEPRGRHFFLLRGKAVVLLGNPKTESMAVMQNDYYWLEVTSCLFFTPMRLIATEHVKSVVQS